MSMRELSITQLVGFFDKTCHPSLSLRLDVSARIFLEFSLGFNSLFFNCDRRYTHYGDFVNLEVMWCKMCLLNAIVLTTFRYMLWFTWSFARWSSHSSKWHTINMSVQHQQAPSLHTGACYRSKRIVELYLQFLPTTSLRPFPSLSHPSQRRTKATLFAPSPPSSPTHTHSCHSFVTQWNAS